jgi:hypothetical protein
LDRITKALLDEFVRQNGLGAMDECDAFERFTGYLLTSSHYPDTFDIEDIAVGAGADCGIDCIAVVVNGCLVTEPEEIEDLATTNGYLDVLYVFVQAERSTNFDMGKVGQIAFGINDFFSAKPQLPQNDRIKHYGAITKEIIDRSKAFRKGNPRCLVYYATTGKWVDDRNLVARRDAAQGDIFGTGLFREVRFECVDADMLQKLYREAQSAVSVEVQFSLRTVMPEMPGVEQAYIGLLPAREFLKVIENSEQGMQSSLFYDNVRDWQDWNPVNTMMKRTVESPENSVYFPLFNNGVTIVAKTVRQTADKFVLEDYQVVNGCQTSYVLHECRDSLTDAMVVPVRLIATKDDDIKRAVTEATNSQTAVPAEQLVALTEFPKKLEAYFGTFPIDTRLYYERRSRQHNADQTVEKVRIVSMTTLVRAFASVFLTQPHRTTRNYKALLKQIGAGLFNKNHRIEPYYVSAYMHYRLDFLFRNRVIAPTFKPARYHILLAARMLAENEPPPALTANSMERYCQKVLEVMWNDVASKELFIEATRVTSLVADGNMHRDNIRTEPFTVRLVDALRRVRKTPS